ncbi:MAG: flagellar biosynthetic protein FliO [Solirubrobacteraceae bacterium]|jgi:flagellar protein FliO/FliZ
MIKCILLSRAVATATAAFGACVLAFASPASAFTPTSTSKTGGESTPLNLNLNASTGASHATSGGGASIVRTIVGLAIVIAVIWGLAWIMRQVKAGREGKLDPGQSSAGLASVAALALGTGRSVHLVRAGSDYVLLGSTEHGVAPIHRYTEQQAREAGLLGDPDVFAEQPSERSRLVAAATQIVAGTGRALVQGARPGQRELPLQGGMYDRGAMIPRGELSEHSPVAGGRISRPDPMRMPSPSSGLLERLRELTVRR